MIGNKHKIGLKQLIVFFALLVLFTSKNYAQCPSVINPLQTFCDLESFLVSDLSAIDNGGGIQWYDTPTSITPLSGSEVLISGEDYYADDNTGACGVRERVDVIIYTAPDGSNFQGVCVENPNDATVADLVATGNNVQWYTTLVGGSPLPLSTVLVDDTIYYADQENPNTGCRTSRLSVLVNVGVVPVPTGDAIQEFCTDQVPPPTVADLVASGTNNWYATPSSAIPLLPTEPLVNGETYYATSVDPPCESSDRFEVTVLFSDPLDPGTSGSIDICESEVGTTPTVDLINGLGGTPDLSGTWSGPFPTSNGSTGTVDITSMTVAGSPYVFTYTVPATSVCSSNSSTVTVSIIEDVDAGTDGSVDLCTDDAPVDLFNSLGGSPDPGGTWSPPLASGTGVFDPSVDAPGTYTYTVTGTAPCGDATADVTVTITPEPDAGTNGSVDLCANDAPVDLFNSLGGSPDPGGTWSPPLASGTGIFDPGIDAPGTYTYTVSGTAPCTGDVTADVTVTVLPEPDAGTDGSVDLCSNDAPVDLFNSLGGSPDPGGTWSPPLASGSGIFDPSIDAPGTYTYTVTGTAPCGDAAADVTVTITPEPDAGTNGSVDLCANDAPVDLFNSLGGSPDPGGTWSPPLASGTGIFDPGIDAPGSYTYTVSGTAPCGDATADVTVTITPEPDAGTDGSLDLCANDAPVDLFNSLGGSPDSGGTWSPPLASGTGIFDPSIDAPGTYTYTLSGTAPCGDATADVTVTITPEPDAGTDGSVDLCANDAPVDLFNSLGGSPDPGGTWSPPLASGTGIFDPGIDAPGTYTYTLNNSCGQTESSIVDVTVSDSLDASGMALTAQDICEGDGNTININGASQLIDEDYEVTYSLSGANSFQETITVTITSGSGSFNIPNTALTNFGITTVTITNLTILTTLCSADVSIIPTVDFEVFESPGTPRLIENGNTFCAIDQPTIADLSANVVGTGAIIWYDAPTNGNAYPESVLLINGAIYYGSFNSSNNCESLVRLEVTVSLVNCDEDIIIPDGFSPNGDGINDDFFIRNLRETYPNFTIEIYNRYGNVLYEGNINTPDWDGTSKKHIGDSRSPVGVYFYILKFNDGSREPIQGRVYLSR